MTTFSLFLVVILVEVISGWVGTLHLPNHRKIYKVPSLKATDGDTDIFASLRTRVAQVSDRQSKLPVVVLDTMLPRQVLRIKSADPIFIDLIRSLDSPNEDGSTFAMIGLHAPNRSRGVSALCVFSYKEGRGRYCECTCIQKERERGWIFCS
mmetsp:Transcript_88917/g.177813  ORF Transcript_88917/g.177813 Transcript_88917/m.177813 type:complete len:152 (+) Transcript_88917:134-589(+)